MELKIDHTLNLVINVDEDTVVHLKPYNKQMLDRFRQIFAQVYMDIEESGLLKIGHTVGKFVLGKYTTEEQMALLYNEWFKTSMVLSSKNGFDPVPWLQALGAGLISEEGKEDIEGFLPFFTGVCQVLRGENRKAMLEIQFLLLKAQSTSSTYTEYANSLKTSSRGVTTEPSEAT